MDLPRALLLDLDDTIIDDSGPDICLREACKHVSERVSVPVIQLFTAVRRQADWYWSDPERHGIGRMDLRAATRQIIVAAFKDLGLRADDPSALQLADNYRDLRDEGLCLFPGALETIEWFRARGVRLGLMTNGSGPGQRAKLERFGLVQHFDCIVIEGEFGVGKPHERVFKTLLQTLACEARDAWAVGDNLEWDVAPLQRLGGTGIWADGRGTGLPAAAAVKPDRIIRTLSELRPRTP